MLRVGIGFRAFVENGDADRFLDEVRDAQRGA